MSEITQLTAELHARAPHLTRLYDLWEQFWVCRALHVLATLGIADLLAEGPLPVEMLAQRTGTHPEALHRVLRLLAAHGILTQPSPRTYELTPLGDCLRSTVPGSARWTFIDDRIPMSSGSLLHSVQTGEAAFEHTYGQPFWTYLAGDPQAGTWFDQQMHAQGLLLQLPSLLTYDGWEDAHTVVDVGGGTGFFLGTLLARFPHLNGVLVDQAAVLERAGDVLEELGVAGRCQRVPGDLFTSVPQGGDIYVLSRVLHDWKDEDAVRILTTVSRAMPTDGRALLLEMVVPPGDTPHRSKAQDVSMLALFGGGRERTEEEYGALLGQGGLDLQRILPTRGPTSILEARKLAGME